MRYSKGKWVASNKDVWSVETTLNKIIMAHITKLYESLQKSSCHGVPMHYMDIQAKIEGVDSYDADVDEADKIRIKDLEELIWVFGNNEPVMEDYDFSIEMVSGKPNEKGNTPVTFITKGEDEKDRYWNDMNVYKERKDKGYKLFGEVYQYLDW